LCSFFFSSRRRHTRFKCDWSSDVCSSDLGMVLCHIAALLQHCKTILVEGSNVAENHPMAFKWIRKAQENGAKIIHVDPRFTRTSATADMYARIRPGADAAFLNAMINHLIVNDLYDRDYVETHTNAL